MLQLIADYENIMKIIISNTMTLGKLVNNHLIQNLLTNIKFIGAFQENIER